MPAASRLRRRALSSGIVGIIAGGSVILGACSPTASQYVAGPGTPSRVVASPDNGSVIVSWDGPSFSAGQVSGYRATAEPSARSCTTYNAATACSIDGLQNGQSYVISVRAFGPGGHGSPSDPVRITAGVPGPPRNVTESPGDSSVSVSWTTAAANGSAVTRQVATSSPGGQTCVTGDSNVCTISGLTNGNAYTLTVVAANARGTGPPSAVAGPVIPQLTAGGSAGITFLGPVFAKGESLTTTLQRDAGFSVPLPNGKDLWVFGDTGEFTNTGNWTATGFVSGSTFAKSRGTRGDTPRSLKNAEIRGGLKSEGGPTQFIPAPTDVYLPNGSQRLCSNGGGNPYSARWPTGAAVLNGSEVLVSYVDVCVQTPSGFSAEGWGFMELNWRTNRIRVGPTDVIPPTVSGTQISPAQSLGSPVVANGRVTFFSSTCAHLFVTCSSGSVYATSLLDTTGALENPRSYSMQSASVSGASGWQPIAVAVSPDSNGSFTLVEQTSIGGTFRIFSGQSASGPWMPEESGTLPGCSSSPHGFCYAFVGHPELGSPTRLVLSYFKPDAGPDPTAGHLVLASVPLAGSNADP